MHMQTTLPRLLSRGSGLLCLLFYVMCHQACITSGPKIIHGKDYNSKFDYYSDAKGDTIRHGSLVGYYSEADGQEAENEGKIRWTATYAHGKFHGPYRDYYPSGKLKYDRNFVDGLEDGIRTGYYESGAVKSVVKLVAGNREGEARTYFEDGQESSVITWVAGIEDGPFKQSYDSGATASGHNIQGEWNGVIQIMRPNGASEETTFISGVRHGPHFETASDGSSFRMHFLNGKAHGLLSSFDVDGNLVFVRGFWHDARVFYRECVDPGALSACSDLMRADQLIMTLRYKSHILFNDIFGVKFHVEDREVGFLGADIVYVEGIDTTLKDILTENYDTRKFRFSFSPSDTAKNLPHFGVLHTWGEDDGMNPQKTDYRLQKIELIDEAGVSVETITSDQDHQ